jgi:E3 ubiquitin-protein ligase SIAH1
MEAGDDSPTSELLAPPPPPLPERIKRSGKRAREGPLLFGTQLVKHEGKDDELVVEAAPQGAEAIVPSESPEKQPAAAVQVDKAKLYCSLCACSLTPPSTRSGS